MYYHICALKVSSDTASTVHKRSTPKIAATIIVAFLGIAGLIAATVYFTDGGNLMSLIASSSSDEPSKIIGDANKDFININIESEKEDSETIDYNDELKPDRHLSAGVFPSLFGSDYNDLNQSDEVDYSDSEEGNISKF